MATTYPDSIQRFPTMQNITAQDAVIVKQYQDAIQAGNMALANSLLSQMGEYLTKFVNADLLNTMGDTLTALQEVFNNRYNFIGITVSSNAPVNPNINDYWWQVL